MSKRRLEPNEIAAIVVVGFVLSMPFFYLGVLKLMKRPELFKPISDAMDLHPWLLPTVLLGFCGTILLFSFLMGRRIDRNLLQGALRQACLNSFNRNEFLRLFSRSFIFVPGEIEDWPDGKWIEERAVDLWFKCEPMDGYMTIAVFTDLERLRAAAIDSPRYVEIRGGALADRLSPSIVYVVDYASEHAFPIVGQEVRAFVPSPLTKSWALIRQNRGQRPSSPLLAKKSDLLSPRADEKLGADSSK